MHLVGGHCWPHRGPQQYVPGAESESVLQLHNLYHAVSPFLGWAEEINTKGNDLVVFYKTEPGQPASLLATCASDHY